MQACDAEVVHDRREAGRLVVRADALAAGVDDRPGRRQEGTAGVGVTERGAREDSAAVVDQIELASGDEGVRAPPRALVLVEEVPEALEDVHRQPDLFASQPAVGAHEVIIHAPEHVTSLADLSHERFAGAVATTLAGSKPRSRAPSALVRLALREGLA